MNIIILWIYIGNYFVQIHFKQYKNHKESSALGISSLDRTIEMEREDFDLCSVWRR